MDLEYNINGLIKEIIFIHYKNQIIELLEEYSTYEDVMNKFMNWECSFKLKNGKSYRLKIKEDF